MKTALLVALLALGCGRSALPGELEVPAPAPPAAPARPACVETPSAPSRWECETVSALEVLELRVSNLDGSAPWSAGGAQVVARVRNASGQALNYPGVQVQATGPSLAPRSEREVLYWLGACGEMELRVALEIAAAPGTPVTFTARPIHVNGDGCAPAWPLPSVTLAAP